MGHDSGRQPGRIFSGKMTPAGDERYLVCAAGAGAVVLGFICSRTVAVTSRYCG